MALSAARIAGRNRPFTVEDQRFQSSIGSASSMQRSTTDDRASLVSSSDVPSHYSVISDLELLFRPIPATPYIITHIAMLLVLFLATLLLPFPFFCKYHACHLQTYTLQTLLHVIVWIVSGIIHLILHKIHFRSYIRGYSEFHYLTRIHRKTPVVVYSVGNALLLLLSLLMRELPPPDQPAPPPYPSQWPLSAFHYVQLLSAMEMLVLFPVLIRYLRLVVRFNAARCPPDVADEDEELRPRTRRPVVKEDRVYNERLMLRQADCIQQLRTHNTRLGRKIVEMHSMGAVGGGHDAPAPAPAPAANCA